MSTRTCVGCKLFDPSFHSWFVSVDIKPVLGIVLSNPACIQLQSDDSRVNHHKLRATMTRRLQHSSDGFVPTCSSANHLSKRRNICSCNSSNLLQIAVGGGDEDSACKQNEKKEKLRSWRKENTKQFKEDVDEADWHAGYSMLVVGGGGSGGRYCCWLNCSAANSMLLLLVVLEVKCDGVDML